MVQLNAVPVFGTKNNTSNIWRKIFTEISVQMVSAAWVTFTQRSTKFPKKNQMVHDIPFTKALWNVDCRSRRCTVFLLILVLYLIWRHFEAALLSQGHIKIHHCFNQMMKSTETEAVLSRFPTLRNLWHFDFRSSLEQLVQNGHMTMLVT